MALFAGRQARLERRRSRRGVPRLDRRVIRRMFGYFGPYWRSAILVLICIVVGAFLGLAPALITKTLIDFLAHPHPDFGRLALIVGAGVAAVIGTGLVGVIQALLMTTISQGIMYDVRGQLFGRLMRQAVGFFTRSHTGELLSRVAGDVAAIDGLVSDTIFGVIQGIVVTLTTLGLMLRLSWPLTLAAIALMPVVLIPTRLAGRMNYRARASLQEKQAEMWGYMQQVLNISGIMLVKAFTKERAEETRFAGLSGDLRRLQVRTAIIQRWFALFGQVFQASGPALLLLLGGYLVVTGNGSVGTIVSVVMILGSRLTAAIGNLAGIHVNVMGGLALFQRIFEYVDMPPAVNDRENAHVLSAVRGAVSFDHVTFSYPEAKEPALDDVSFDVEPGQLIALVGPSGAGKTTATYLLARLYDPDRGCVRVDGLDLRDLALESLSRHIGVVYQDTFLFHATLRENLLYARPGATDEEMRAAARAAQIEHYIESLPAGYDTIVGERGHRLSGGEKQRIAIARVILRDPRIVILDEATSNLDTLSEQLIQEALQPLLAGRTAFVIAHRLSTILAADMILVLQDGKLVEQGTHRDLLARDGLYRKLCEYQFDLTGVAQ